MIKVSKMDDHLTHFSDLARPTRIMLMKMLHYA